MTQKIPLVKPLTALESRAPTMADVARRAGVSKMTVSRLLMNEALVAEDARKRIRAAIEELNYIPDMVAGALSSGRSGFVALLVPSLNSTHFLHTARGLTESLLLNGLQVLLGYTDYSVEREEQLIEAMLRRRPEALVVTGGTHTARARKLLERARIPVIETWDLPKQPIDRVVGFSNASAAALVADHFAHLGFREIAFLGGPIARDPRGHDRQLGFLRRAAELNMKAHALNFGERPISIDGGKAAIADALAQWPKVQAVMCVFDLCAFGVLNGLAACGLRIPQDIAVAGFGDFEIALHTSPPLTTVRIDAEEIGRRAGMMISAALSAHPRQEVPAGEIMSTLSPRLIVRHSTQAG